MTKTLCIYHGNCADGFGAAWAVRHAFKWARGAVPLEKIIDFHAGVYQDPPPDVTDCHVLMVDFSYKRPVLDEMAATARSMLILDHHKSAADDLADYPAPPETWHDWIKQVSTTGPQVAAVFDMERSGAGIAWDFFHDAARPPLIEHIEDRDLWRFGLAGTREIQAAVFSYPYDFQIWDELMLDRELAGLMAEGVAIERKHHKDIDELIDVTLRFMVIGGQRVPVANLPYTMTSDAGNKLAEGNAFAACYWDTPEGRVFSLRSWADGADVSVIAKSYGGGGHRNAAGFRLPYERLDEIPVVP